MGFRHRLKYFMVHRLSYSGREADALIRAGRLKIGRQAISENVFYSGEADLFLDDTLLHKAPEYRYVLYYKPRGIETTFGTGIENNLESVLPAELRDLRYAGRLDKESEGLLLLTDDGALIHSLANPDVVKEKEYIVTVDKILTDEFTERMQRGIVIEGYMTKPCTVKQENETTFRIVLTEGRNRQIRRMCYKLGYEVQSLLRVRIDAYRLGDLKPGEWAYIST